MHQPRDESPHRPPGRGPGRSQDVGPHRSEDRDPDRSPDLGPERPEVRDPRRSPDLGPHRSEDRDPRWPRDVGSDRPPGCGLDRAEDRSPYRPPGRGPGRSQDVGPHRPSGLGSDRPEDRDRSPDLGPRRPRDVAPERPEDRDRDRSRDESPDRPSGRGPRRPPHPKPPAQERGVGPFPFLARALGLTLTLTLVVGGLAGCAERGEQGAPGAAGLGDPYFPDLGNGGYDVTHYGLTLDYDPATGHLDAGAEITARATQRLSAFNLDLAGLTVGRVTVDGERAGVRRADTELTLLPSEDIARGDTFRTVVRYSGVPRTLTDADSTREGWLRSGRRSVALGQPTGSMAWFPGNHHPSDKAAYDIRITVPEGQQAVSNGELTSERTAGGRTAFGWHCAEPMASYLATVAVGPYRTKISRGADGGVPVHTAVDPSVAADSARLLARIPAIMKWGEKRFGPYPFSSTGVIIGRPGDADYALETQNRPFLPGPTSTAILVHELAHQWFGDSVTPESWRDIWLNEGFAEYAAWLWAEDMEGVPARQAFERAYEDAANWAFPPAEPPTAADISGRPVYGRGAMVLHQLRLAVGDDAFFALVRGWTRAHRHGNASTADFTAFAQKRTGRDLTALWDDWLYGSDKPPPGA